MKKEISRQPKVKLSGLVQRVIIMCTILVALLYFAEIFNTVVFFVLAWFYLLAIVAEGFTRIKEYLTSIKEAKKK